MSITRLARYGALVALLLGTLLVGPAGAGASPAARETWVGQVQRHARHFDYSGSPCPVDPAVMCPMYVATYRIVPVTRQATRALPVVAGGTARLIGHLQSGRDAQHQGKLVVTHVEANNPPPPPPPPPGKSGVDGTVMAGPTCPVVRPDNPCPDRPVETDLRLAPANGSKAITGHSGADGRFRIEAPAGHYRLTATYASGPGCQPVDLDVKAGRFTHADVSCDTGIR